MPSMNAAAQDVVAQERGRRMHQQIDGAGAPAALVHLPRRQRRVAVDAIEVIAQVAVRVVLQLLRQLADGAVHDDRLVHVLALPARRAPVVEARLIVGIEVGGADPAPEMKGDARDAIAALRRVVGEQRSGSRRPAPA